MCKQILPFEYIQILEVTPLTFIEMYYLFVTLSHCIIITCLSSDAPIRI